MRPVASGDEKQRVARGRIERGINCRATGHRNRRRRKTCCAVGVIRRIAPQISAREVSVEGIAKLKKALNPENMRVVFNDAGFKGL